VGFAHAIQLMQYGAIAGDGKKPGFSLKLGKCPTFLSEPRLLRQMAILERENPWTEFIGMFEGDAEFAAIAAELRAERELDDVA
jgi:hypothetical protein